MLVDTHCHLDFETFSNELDAVVERAHQAGVKRMVTISTLVRDMEKLLDITRRFDDVYCSVGTHPSSSHEENDTTAEKLLQYAKNPKVVAIGEVGLDYHYDDATPQEQKRNFHEHIVAARESGLPLVIHTRDADIDTSDILVEEMKKGEFSFILHSFSSGQELAKTALEIGGYISFSGILTFKSAENLRNIAKTVPVDRVLVETDSPYLAPVPFRGKTNEPSFVKQTALVLADVLGVPFDEIAKHTTENAYRIFSKMK